MEVKAAVDAIILIMLIISISLDVFGFLVIQG